MKSNIIARIPHWKARSPPFAGLQPVLHPQARHHRARSCCTAPGRCRKRGSSTRSRNATDLHRHRPGPRARPRSPVSSAAPCRRCSGARSWRASRSKTDRRVTELVLTAKGRAGVCRTRQPLARRGRGACSAGSTTGGARRPGRRHDHHRAGAGAAGAKAGRLPAAQPSPRRHRLGRVAARRALCAGIWLGHQFRSAGRRDRRAVPRDHSTRRASIAGSPRSTASRSARSSWSGHPTRSRNCGCCWWRKKARGLGVGARWSSNASASRGDSGYRSITLWTQSILVAARGIYQRAGFRAGRNKSRITALASILVGETWELKL